MVLEPPLKRGRREIFPSCSFGGKNQEKKKENSILTADVGPPLKGGTEFFVLQEGTIGQLNDIHR